MNLTQYIEGKHDEHLNDLFEFLRIPSVSAQSDHKPDIERAAKWVEQTLSAEEPVFHGAGDQLKLRSVVPRTAAT